jgi:predicted ribosome quality control (RQC) complex YloA/Tae2 family protein
LSVLLESTSLLARVARARAKLVKRIIAISNDLNNIHTTEALAVRVQPLLPIAAKAPRGTRKLTGTDWGTGEPLELELDTARSPREQLEAIFAKAKRLRRGAPIAEQRLAEARRCIAELDACEAALAADAPDLEAIDLRIHKILPHEVRAASASPREREIAKALPYRSFLASTGVRVLVGRGAAHNDDLTFHVAKPYHLWLHARGVSGAHVIVPLGREQSCPADVLVDAAHLAAHFSDARGEPNVEITTALRKHVRKPRGSAPGAVLVEREKVVSLRVEPERLARLLAAET